MLNIQVGHSYFLRYDSKQWERGKPYPPLATIQIAASNHVLANMEHLPGWVGLAPLIFGIAGIGLAYVMYMFIPALPDRLATAFRPVYLFLLNKWYFDELYDKVFVRPYMALARQLWQRGLYENSSAGTFNHRRLSR